MGKPIFKNKLIIRFLLVLATGVIFLGQGYALPVNNKPNEVHTPAAIFKSNHHNEAVVLIHGLMRTSKSMKPLESYLKALGYHVYYYSYPSAKYSIQAHGVYLNQFIDKLLKSNSGIKIHFITHSLGGIIAREALSKRSKRQLKNIGSLIMLAPPNQGSKLAKLSTKIFPLITASIKPLAQLSSDESSYVHRIPPPFIKVGIIAGRFDAKVPPYAARLEGLPEPIVINSNHMFIMSNAKTKELVREFLEQGKFINN